jgi:hypothetical protein
MIQGRDDDIHGFFSVPFLPRAHNMRVEQTTPASSGRKDYIHHQSSLLGRWIGKHSHLNGPPQASESA